MATARPVMIRSLINALSNSRHELTRGNTITLDLLREAPLDLLKKKAIHGKN
jgi:hypothetical protein